jgi:DNA-binding transcriptional LysR family regulator
LLHVTQPAVSGQIKALEEELGIALFDRKPGRIVLTRAGERMLSEAEKVLEAAGSLLAKARALQGEVSGALVIGTVGDPDSLRLGSLLGGLVSALPLLEIKTRAGDAEVLREAVATATLQASFYIGPNIPREVSGLPLQSLQYRIAAPFSFSQRVLHAGWREIADMPWIGAPATSHAQTLLRDLFSRQGLLPNITLESDHTAAPQSLVRSGLGLALLREDIAVPMAAQDLVVIWPHTRVSAMLSFIYPKSAEHDPVIVAALSVLRTVWGLPAR